MTLEERISRLSRKSDSSDCVLWLGTKDHKGYGRVKIGRRGFAAHRMVWELTHGSPVPPGMLVCHTCDNRACVNPEHLWVGTTADNARDMARKGRHGVRVRSSGEPTSKITAEQVQMIRRDLRDGIRKSEIARRFGLTGEHVGKIASGAIWSWLAFDE